MSFSIGLYVNVCVEQLFGDCLCETNVANHVLDKLPVYVLRFTFQHFRYYHILWCQCSPFIQRAPYYIVSMTQCMYCDCSQSRIYCSCHCVTLCSRPNLIKLIGLEFEHSVTSAARLKPKFVNSVNSLNLQTDAEGQD